MYDMKIFFSIRFYLILDISKGFGIFQYNISHIPNLATQCIFSIINDSGNMKNWHQGKPTIIELAVAFKEKLLPLAKSDGNFLNMN